MSTAQFLAYLHASPATLRLAESLAAVLTLRGRPRVLAVAASVPARPVRTDEQVASELTGAPAASLPFRALPCWAALRFPDRPRQRQRTDPGLRRGPTLRIPFTTRASRLGRIVITRNDHDRARTPPRQLKARAPEQRSRCRAPSPRLPTTTRSASVSAATCAIAETGSPTTRRRSTRLASTRPRPDVQSSSSGSRCRLCGSPRSCSMRPTAWTATTRAPSCAASPPAHATRAPAVR